MIYDLNRVIHIPLFPRFSLYVKGGSEYGETDVSGIIKIELKIKVKLLWNNLQQNNQCFEKL